jgi:hypothetical protein
MYEFVLVPSCSKQQQQGAAAHTGVFGAEGGELGIVGATAAERFSAEGELRWWRAAAVRVLWQG